MYSPVGYDDMTGGGILCGDQPGITSLYPPNGYSSGGGSEELPNEERMCWDLYEVTIYFEWDWYWQCYVVTGEVWTKIADCYLMM